MKLLLSTSNIIGGGSSVRGSATSKSNAELISSLRANFQDHYSSDADASFADASSQKLPPAAWTRWNGDTLEIPQLDSTEQALQEGREQYDITAKLFFLPNTSVSDRPAQAKEAVDLVMKQLSVPSIDLLILSFPGIWFDEQEDCPDKISTRGPVEAEPESLESQIPTWRALEEMHRAGTVAKLGVAEFGKERLEAILEQADVKPSVDQINLRDCCSVPRDLMTLAKAREVDLLVHNDCSNILPRGTTRELLGNGPEGAGILFDQAKTGEKRKQAPDGEAKAHATLPLSGEVYPQWVVKYTAVVKNRGVVESKGYLAVANLSG